ncbi:MAG: DUF362 domain-containing protein [Clostridiaceae bacterium]|nr:DUF362 domain-containing protein [Clostridiaceae bacterium]
MRQKDNQVKIKKLPDLENKITVIYGSDIFDMTLKILNNINLKSHLEPNSFIGLKPNLVLNNPPSNGATTHLEIAEALVCYLQEAGFDNIIILEGSWVGDSTKAAYRDLGWQEMAEQRGVELLDTKTDDYVILEHSGHKMAVSRTATQLDYLINIPVMKGHCQTKMTGALKNMKGLISDSEKRAFHRKGLHMPIAALNVALPQSLIITDGICGDLDFEEGGNPVPMNRLFCTADPVLNDSYMASCMGYKPEEIEHLRLAAELNVGSTNLAEATITELNEARVPIPAVVPGAKVSYLEQAVDEQEACSACYANLIQALARYDERYNLSDFFQDKIKVGQAFKGEKGSGFGSGICTAGFSTFVTGCPPSTPEILDALIDYKSK